MSEIELTEEEIKANLKAERVEKYKNTQKYILSDEYKEMLKYFEEKWESLLPEIKNEIATRTKVEAIKSEVDKIYAFSLFLKEVQEKLGESEGAKVISEIIDGQIEAADSNMHNKVEELGDVPIYTKLDFTKQLRIDYLLVGQRIERWSDSFLDKKEDKMDLHPYED